MKIELNMVKTMAWMKQTRNSRHIMKMLITTLSVDIPMATPIPIVATTKMMHVKERAMACPAIMLAKRRIISANGLVNIPTNSIRGISGKAFKANGTFGQKMSFQ